MAGDRPNPLLIRPSSPLQLALPHAPPLRPRPEEMCERTACASLRPSSMNLRLDPDQPLAKELPRILTEVATAPLPEDRVERIRQLRTRGKRLRAIFRLLREVWPVRSKREELFVRDLLKPWGALRDQDVLASWAGSKAKRPSPPTTPQDASGLTEQFASTEAALQGLARRVKRWPWKAVHVEHLRASLQRSHKRFRKRGAQAKKAGAFHDWRKATKSYGHQSELCAEFFSPAEKQARRLKKLAHDLGEEHDAAIVRERLPESSEAKDAALHQVADRIFALARARKILAHPPKRWRRKPRLQKS